jgi:succinate dehydrogenase/fumarate reductase flavoprotein subunit
VHRHSSATAQFRSQACLARLQGSKLCFDLEYLPFAVTASLHALHALQRQTSRWPTHFRESERRTMNQIVKSLLSEPKANFAVDRAVLSYANAAPCSSCRQEQTDGTRQNNNKVKSERMTR